MIIWNENRICTVQVGKVKSKCPLCKYTDRCKYRHSSAYTVFKIMRFILGLAYFGTLIWPFSTKSLLRFHGFLLTKLFFQSLKRQRKQKTPCIGYLVTQFLGPENYHFPCSVRLVLFNRWPDCNLHSCYIA